MFQERFDHRVDLIWRFELVEMASSNRSALDDSRDPLRHEIRRVERGGGGYVQHRCFALRRDRRPVELKQGL